MQKVLIVDDHKPILEALILALSDDFEVKVTSSAAEALQIVPEFNPDILLTDNKMAGMSGLELLHHLKDSPCPKRKIMFSANLTTEEEQQAFALGIELHIVKPFSISTLLNILHNSGSYFHNS